MGLENLKSAFANYTNISKISGRHGNEKEGYPHDNGLVISGVLFRRHNEKDVIKVMEDWWHEIKYHSHICQLSLPYVFWKNKFKGFNK